MGGVKRVYIHYNIQERRLAAAVRFLVGSFTIFVAIFFSPPINYTYYIRILFVDRVGIN